MTERQRTIIRMALSFTLSNLDAIKELFRLDLLPAQDEEEIVLDPVLRKYEDYLSYNGDIIPMITEDEIDELMMELQG